MVRESSSAEPSAMIVPPARIRMRSASRSASSRSCVVSRIVAASRSASRWMRSWNSRRASGSNPAVGSSRKSTSGRPTIPIATSSRRRCPPDRVRTRWPACSVSPTVSEQIVDVPRPRHLRRGVRRVVAAQVRKQLADMPLGVVPPRLQHHPDPRAPRLITVRGIRTEHTDMPGRPHPESLQHLDRGGLARAVRPEQHQHLTAPRREADPGQHIVLGVPHPQVADIEDIVHAMDDSTCTTLCKRAARRRRESAPQTSNSVRGAPLSSTSRSVSPRRPPATGRSTPGSGRRRHRRCGGTGGQYLSAGFTPAGKTASARCSRASSRRPASRRCAGRGAAGCRRGPGRRRRPGRSRP